MRTVRRAMKYGASDSQRSAGGGFGSPDSRRSVGDGFGSPGSPVDSESALSVVDIDVSRRTFMHASGNGVERDTRSLVHTVAPPFDFRMIPRFPNAKYEVDVPWDLIEATIVRWTEAYGLDLDPDFQRAHVWSTDQRIAYLEHIMMGGEVGRSVTFNSANWMKASRIRKGCPLVLIDGKQRLESVRMFLRDELRTFDRLFSEFAPMGGGTVRLDMLVCSFRFRVCTLETRADVLRFYLGINGGGTPHTSGELERVRGLLREEDGTSA